MSETAEARVARGAAYLDENEPGWERRVDLASLNIMDCRKCVIGQSQGEDEWVKLADQHGHSWIDERAFAGNDHLEAWISLLKERFDSGLLSDEAVA